MFQRVVGKNFHRIILYVVITFCSYYLIDYLYNNSVDKKLSLKLDYLQAKFDFFDKQQDRIIDFFSQYIDNKENISTKIKNFESISYLFETLPTKIYWLDFNHPHIKYDAFGGIAISNKLSENKFYSRCLLNKNKKIINSTNIDYVFNKKGIIQVGRSFYSREGKYLGQIELIYDTDKIINFFKSDRDFYFSILNFNDEIIVNNTIDSKFSKSITINGNKVIVYEQDYFNVVLVIWLGCLVIIFTSLNILSTKNKKFNQLISLNLKLHNKLNIIQKKYAKLDRNISAKILEQSIQKLVISKIKKIQNLTHDKLQHEQLSDLIGEAIDLNLDIALERKVEVITVGVADINLTDNKFLFIQILANVLHHLIARAPKQSIIHIQQLPLTDDYIMLLVKDDGYIIDLQDISKSNINNYFLKSLQSIIDLAKANNALVYYKNVPGDGNEVIIGLPLINDGLVNDHSNVVDLGSYTN